MLDFTGKVVMITGAAQGFGRVLALAFADRGARLALCDINDAGGQETLDLATSRGAEGFHLHVDVAREAEVEGFVAQTLVRFGRLDVAVNNAAKEIAGPTLDLPSGDFDTLIDTNLKGTYYGMKHQVAAMRRTGGGAIVNQASVTSSMTGEPDNGLYGASKGGVIGLTKSAALQVAAENISINAIASCAFDIPNDVFLRWIEDHDVSREEAAETLPIKRLGRPEEIAAATLYLASDEARFVVGSVLTIDGGFTARSATGQYCAVAGDDMLPRRDGRRGGLPMRMIATTAAAVLLAILAVQEPLAAEFPEGITTASTAIGDVLVDASGMTLYSFDEDPAGASACYGTCAENWPPLEAPAGAAPIGAFAVIARDDGKAQWAYDGRPLYLWVRDKAPGDITGDGFRGWHAVRP
ncbi:SDR family oxidoreductase [Microbaculum marinum]|uniref:SDR family oxidoreductase n=1 Tax=Microbaculum marinum TaxID=1764581 RepID=A0AAW9RR10_9HYPH